MAGKRWRRFKRGREDIRNRWDVTVPAVDVAKLPSNLQVKIDSLLEKGRDQEAKAAVERYWLRHMEGRRGGYQKRVKALKCTSGRRYTTVTTEGDTYAARSFEQAMDVAHPDPGSWVTVRVVCAPNMGAARFSAKRDGVVVRRFITKGRR